MKRFVQGIDRTQSILFPAQLEDYVAQDNPVRVIDAFVEMLDLAALGFDGTASKFWFGLHQSSSLHGPL
jgi:transposase